MNNKYWSWSPFWKLLAYYLVVFLLFLYMHVFNISLYIIFSIGFAALCTFINSQGLEDWVNDLYYAINDMVFSSMKSFC